MPEAEITDWPDLEMRIIYWDDAHHLEPLPVLKRAVRQAAFYKINGFAIKFERHFQYKHAEPLVEPYALSPTEFQGLTDYGLKYHVQVIPYLDAPSHIAFILKHPEYARRSGVIGIVSTIRRSLRRINSCPFPPFHRKMSSGWIMTG